MSHARPLGLWAAIALVVGNMIGSGVFLLPASLAPYGGVSLAGWAITLAGALALALTFARLAMRWPQTGGPYVFARNAFGEMPGFLIAWSYWVSIWCANAAIAVAFAGSVGALVPQATAPPLRGAACALAGLWFCIGVNVLGVREAGRVQLLLTVLKFVPLLLFAGIALWFVQPQHFIEPFNPSGESLPHAINATVALTLWALLGLEAATVPAGAIENAERTVPLATVVGALLAGVVTVFAVSAVLGLLPAAQLKDSTAPMADAARALWGPWAGLGIAAVAAISCLGALNGWTLLSGQLPFAAARDGVLPAHLAKLDRNGTPAFGVLASGVLASLLVAANYSRSLAQLFTFSILLSTAATLLPYLAGAAAWLVRGERKGRLLALVGFLYSAYALFGIGHESLLWGVALLLAGLPVYAWMRYVKARR